MKKILFVLTILLSGMVSAQTFDFSCKPYVALSVNWQVNGANVSHNKHDFDYNDASALTINIQGTNADDATITAYQDNVNVTDSLSGNSIGTFISAINATGVVTDTIESLVEVSDGTSTASDTVVLNEKDPPLGVLNSGIDVTDISNVHVILTDADQAIVDAADSFGWRIGTHPMGLVDQDHLDNVYKFGYAGTYNAYIGCCSPGMMYFQFGTYDKNGK